MYFTYFMKKRVAIFPGSFDPITIGHYAIVIRALKIFDSIIIGIGNNSNKKYMFKIEKRKIWIENTFNIYKNKIIIECYNGLTTTFCIKKKVNFIIRGLRNIEDFKFEKFLFNKNFSKKIETIFFISSIDKSYISSSIVRNIIINNGNYKKLVPKCVNI